MGRTDGRTDGRTGRTYGTDRCNTYCPSAILRIRGGIKIIVVSGPLYIMSVYAPQNI